MTKTKRDATKLITLADLKQALAISTREILKHLEKMVSRVINRFEAHYKKIAGSINRIEDSTKSIDTKTSRLEKVLISTRLHNLELEKRIERLERWREMN